MGLVSKIATLTQLSPEGAQWLSEHIEERTFKKNQVILREHQVSDYLYYVKKGLLCGYYHQSSRDQSKEICSWLSLEDDLATSYYSFISRKPSYETIECVEPTTVQVLSYANMQELYHLFPETEKAGRMILEEYYSRIEERLYSIRFKSSQERYKTFVETRPKLITRAPLGRVASYLGMTQETLSRVRSAYKG
jgi:CRP-like cAMP-binding protein